MEARDPVIAPSAPPAPPAGTGFAQPINQSPIRTAQYNLLCILGLVISAIALILSYFGLLGLAIVIILMGLGGIIVSVIGLVQCNRKKENGRILGVLGIILGVFSILAILI